MQCECGYVSLTMVGKCRAVWGSMEEEAPITMTKEGIPPDVKAASPLRGLDVEEQGARFVRDCRT